MMFTLLRILGARNKETTGVLKNISIAISRPTLTRNQIGPSGCSKVVVCQISGSGCETLNHYWVMAQAKKVEAQTDRRTNSSNKQLHS